MQNMAEKSTQALRCRQKNVQMALFAQCLRTALGIYWGVHSNGCKNRLIAGDTEGSFLKERIRETDFSVMNHGEVLSFKSAHRADEPSESIDL
jgi:hypothetical protein